MSASLCSKRIRMYSIVMMFLNSFISTYDIFFKLEWASQAFTLGTELLK